MYLCQFYGAAYKVVDLFRFLDIITFKYQKSKVDDNFRVIFWLQYFLTNSACVCVSQSCINSLDLLLW